MSERRVRAVRGATTVARDDPALILAATCELLRAIAEHNALVLDDVISVLFTVSDDLRSEFPARAAREMGWRDVPLLCAQEVPVPGSLARCIRVLLHAYTTRTAAEVRHVYLHEARSLRPDLATES